MICARPALDWRNLLRCRLDAPRLPQELEYGFGEGVPVTERVRGINHSLPVFPTVDVDN